MTALRRWWHTRTTRTDNAQLRARAELRAELDTARARLARNQHLGGAR